MLALGATRMEAARGVLNRAVLVALTPVLNQLNVVGIVSIPGMMTGQILVGGGGWWCGITGDGGCVVHDVLQHIIVLHEPCAFTRTQIHMHTPNTEVQYSHVFVQCLLYNVHTNTCNITQGGSDPSDAARYQIMIMFLVSASTALGSTMAVLGTMLAVIDSEHRLRAERLVQHSGKPKGLNGAINAGVQLVMDGVAKGTRAVWGGVVTLWQRCCGGGAAEEEVVVREDGQEDEERTGLLRSDSR